MKSAKLEEIFAETVSAVNFSNGVVRIFFAGQDLDHLASGQDISEAQPQNRFCVTMTLPGFLYAMSVVQGFVENEKFQSVVQRSVEAGFLPKEPDAATDQATH